MLIGVRCSKTLLYRNPKSTGINKACAHELFASALEPPNLKMTHRDNYSTAYLFQRETTFNISQIEDSTTISLRGIQRNFASWNQETHYTVLGVKTDASQAEIREAYLKLSKKLHPDYNTGKQLDEAQKQFIKVNEAYNVLSNKSERRLYDLKIGKGEDINEPTQSNRSHARMMTFEERARMMGFPRQDPDFYEKHGNYHKRVVKWCILFIIFGICVQYPVVLYISHKRMDKFHMHSDNIAKQLEEDRAARAKIPSTGDPIKDLTIRLNPPTNEQTQDMYEKDLTDIDLKKA